jgi:hypothetical protein
MLSSVSVGISGQLSSVDCVVDCRILRSSARLSPRTSVTGIDASGFERAHTSTHYTNLTIQQLKTTPLVDTDTNAVLDIQLTTTRKHDNQIPPQ